MTLDDLNNLDLKTLADWPLATKLVALAVLCAAIVTAGWWFDWRGNMEALDVTRQKETELRAVFTTKKKPGYQSGSLQESTCGYRTGVRCLVETASQ